MSPPADPSSSHSAPAIAPTPVVILGADAVLAALPATAVQLSQACLRLGYRTAVPASWGDELLAAGYLQAVERRGGRPAICASCPRVTARLAGDRGPGLTHFLLPMVPSPVAAARYLRRIAGSTPLHVTLIGGCPVGATAEIDDQRTPAELLALLAERGVRLEEQPTTFEGVLPPDRRRWLSVPGGLPTTEALWARDSVYRLVEVTGDDYTTEIAELLLSGEPVLVDVAPRLGCVCSGAVAGVTPTNARSVVMALEPPRATGPVLDPLAAAAVPVLDDMPGPPPLSPPRSGERPLGRTGGPPAPTGPATGVSAPPTAAPISWPPPTPNSAAPPRATPAVSGSMRTIAAVGSHRTPVTTPRIRSFPQARAEDGRLLPRAYVAHRHSLTDAPVIPAEPAHPAPSAGTQGATPTPPDVRAVVAPHFASAAAEPGMTTAGPRPGGYRSAVATPPAGVEFEAFVAGVTAIVSHHVLPAVEPWRDRLTEAIERWRAAGYDTGVLERARALHRQPDVEGLLGTYAAAADYLRRLEALATTITPTAEADAVFRDPEHVEVAEAFVDELLAT